MQNWRDEIKNRQVAAAIVDDRLMGVLVEKCGLTTICSLAAQYYAKHPGLPYETRTCHTKLYVEPLNQNTEQRRIFAVWRDPVKRWRSFYNEKIVKAHKGAVWVEAERLYHASADEMIRRTEEEIDGQVPDVVDPHIRRQTDFDYLHLVDDIVLIGDLDAYLLSHGITPIEHQNASGSHHITLTEEQEHRLRALYAADYEILQSPKLWKPCTTSVQ